jgi:2-oxoglutarate decarboxylase
VAAVVVKNMTASLEVPTATSVRAVPAKLMADNRVVINNFLKRNRGGRSPSPTSSGTPSSAPSPTSRT